jgi:hypothetical protein
MPASDSAAAIEARVREMVLVTKASGSPASRNRAAAYWPQAAAGPPSHRLPAVGAPAFPPACTAAAPALARPRTR